jgi:hypothetical protein
MNLYLDIVTCKKSNKVKKNIKTILLELRPVYHKNDERIDVMLSYYLPWHANERLKPFFKSDGKDKDRR